MTHAIALTGQWEGLRAFPRAPRTPDHRKRLENGLERLGGLYEQMAARAAMLHAGLERLNGLRAALIEELDASDTDADLEADGCDEPSLCGLGMNLAAVALDDLEDQCEDEGGQCEDEGADETDDEFADLEPSLVTLMTTAADQSGSRWTGGCDTLDREDDGDAEPPYGGIHMWSAGVEEAGVR